MDGRGGAPQGGVVAVGVVVTGLELLIAGWTTDQIRAAREATAHRVLPGVQITPPYGEAAGYAGVTFTLPLGVTTERLQEYARAWLFCLAEGWCPPWTAT